MKNWKWVLIISSPILLGWFIVWGFDTNWSYFYTGINDYALKHCYWKSVYGDYFGDPLYFSSDNFNCTDCGHALDEKYNVYFNGVKKGRVINATSERLTIITLDGRRGYYVCK